MNFKMLIMLMRVDRHLRCSSYSSCSLYVLGAGQVKSRGFIRALCFSIIYMSDLHFIVSNSISSLASFLMVAIKRLCYQHGQLSLDLEKHPCELDPQVQWTFPLVPRWIKTTRQQLSHVCPPLHLCCHACMDDVLYNASSLVLQHS